MLFEAIFYSKFFQPSLSVGCTSWEIVMGFGCGLALVLMGGMWGVTMPSLRHFQGGILWTRAFQFLQATLIFSSETTSRKNYDNEAQGGKGKGKRLLGRQQTAPGESRSGRGRAEQEQVHLVGTAFSCSFVFRCQTALRQTEQNTTCPPGFPSWSSTCVTDLTCGCDVAAGARHQLHLSATPGDWHET